MKTINLTLAGLMVSGAFARAADVTDLNQNENHLTLSARLGFNIHAQFSNRATPDGLPYNYLDGYVLHDSTGDYDPTATFPGITQNWGYDNSTRQVNNPMINNYPTVAMTRFGSGVNPMTSQMQEDPVPGLELSYMRHIGSYDKWHYGIEGAANFQTLNLAENGTTSGTGVRDYYQYFNGTTLPNSPYQGHYDASVAPNAAQISDTVAGSAPVSTIKDVYHREFDADIWGFRLGPYLNRQFGQHFTFNAVGGLAVAVVDGSASWNETLTVGNNAPDPTTSGSGSGTSVLWGYYVGLDANYHFNERWSAKVGAQFQDLGTYRQNVGSRVAELDLSQSVFVQLGISYSF